MSAKDERAQVLRDVAERVSLWNEFRTDDFQDAVVKVVNAARELWRGEDGELPPRGKDRAFDALMELAASADSSPLAVRDAATRLLRAADGSKTAR